MSIRPGEKIGPYSITSAIGAGGMGEVYRARDTRLNRDVAIKVLPGGFAKNVDGVARFRREAQVLASLNHQNIASIYGLEESNGDLALALELVEGEDLAERLKQGPIPVDEALAIAKQIADGLEAAHERGIIHRDLKPANIKVTKSGLVKILDFGLAKAYEGETSLFDSGVSQSPTQAHLATQAGMILGTAAYMSPEQARGKPVDKRADVWAFGVVVYEMLTGKRLFDGETVSDTLAAVLTKEPDLSALPPSTPVGLRRMLKHCLARDPKKRLRDIGDVFLDLEEPETITHAGERHSARRINVIPWIVASLAIAAAIWLFWDRQKTSKISPDVMRMEISFPRDVEPFSGLQGGFTLSPDGKIVAMIGVREGVRRLYIRRLDRSEAEELSDTMGVNSAQFSPDSKSIALVPGTTVLTRISLTNLERVEIVKGADLAGNISWGSQYILFNRGGALWVVEDRGGTPRQLATLDTSRHEVLQADPLLLPDNRTVLFSSLTTDFGTERIEAVSIDGKDRRVIVEHAITPVLSPTGHLLFGRDGALWAVRFDAQHVKTIGEAVPIIPAGTIGSVRTGSLGYSLSSNGTLVFIPLDFDFKRMMTVERDGAKSALSLSENRFGNPRISPDGRRLLVETAGSTIETLDFQRGTRSRLTPAALGTSFCTWTADGEGVVFRRFNVPFWAAADGSGKSGALPDGVVNDYPSSPGPDPDSIVEVRIQPNTAGDIFLMSISGKFKPKPLLVTPAYEGGAQLSSDHQWMLYQSNQSGQPEIYVRRYPAMDREWQISEGGGVQPRWSRNGREIYYRNGKQMMAVTLDPSSSEPVFGKPVGLFPDEYDFGQGVSIANYDVDADGRFIMLQRGTHGSNLHVVLNWTEELKKIFAAGGAR